MLSNLEHLRKTQNTTKRQDSSPSYKATTPRLLTSPTATATSSQKRTSNSFLPTVVTFSSTDTYKAPLIKAIRQAKAQAKAQQHNIRDYFPIT
jgi:hypothetical protein